MQKTKDELNRLKKEYEELKIKLNELDSDELEKVTGGVNPDEHNIMLLTNNEDR